MKPNLTVTSKVHLKFLWYSFVHVKNAQNLEDEEAIIIKVNSLALQQFSNFSKIACTVIYVVFRSVVPESNSWDDKVATIYSSVVSIILFVTEKKKDNVTTNKKCRILNSSLKPYQVNDFLKMDRNTSTIQVLMIGRIVYELRDLV